MERPSGEAADDPVSCRSAFQNYGGSAADARLADGLVEDIITDLSRFHSLGVIARNSTEVYKGKPVDVRVVGKDLNVRYVLARIHRMMR